MNVKTQVARKKGWVGNCTGLENNEALRISVNSTHMHARTHACMLTYHHIPSHVLSESQPDSSWGYPATKNNSYISYYVLSPKTECIMKC